MSAAVSVVGVSKKFRMHTEKRNSLKERLVRGRGHTKGEFWALKDVTFDVPRGTTFGLVGHNGSGKSTMLKVLAGVHRPTSGSVVTDGRISALLEVGAGFHGELTGRENIYLNGSILGLSRREIDASMDRIIEFSGIGDFIEAPVKVYSSGMYVRLGFSIAVTVDPEILIVDEIIAVGDEEFQRKCFDHLFELRKRGTTIVLVSHAMGIVEDLCDSAVWLDHGEVKMVGESREVVQGYLDEVNARETAGQDAPPPVAHEVTRRGSGEVRITGVEYVAKDGSSAPVLFTGEPARFRLSYRAQMPVEEAHFGIAFTHESGVYVAGPNSTAGPPPIPVLAAEGSVEFEVPALTLSPGTYEVSAAVSSRGHTYDLIDRGFDLRVRGTTGGEPGLIRMFGRWVAGPESAIPGKV